MTKNDFEKIIEQTAEAMAVAAINVPECVTLINQYRKDNYDATTKYTKDICSGKYELERILGLGNAQMQTAAIAMAVFLCCGNKADKDFLITMVRTYAQNPTVIEDHLLQTEFYDLILQQINYCAEMGKTVELDIQSGSIHNETKAFAFAYLLSVTTNKEIEAALIRSFAVSNIHTHILPSVKDKPNFKYLMFTTVKERFKSKNLHSSVMDDLHRLKSKYISLDDDEVYNRWAFTVRTFTAALTSNSMLKGEALHDFVLTKGDINDIATIAYFAVNLDAVPLPLDDIWACCDKNDTSKYDSKDVELAKKERQEFEYALANASYYYYLCKQYRRQILNNLYDCFFNPQGLKLDAELKKCNKRIDRDKVTIQAQEEKIKQLSVCANEAEKTATEARNRLAGIQSKVETQQQQIEALKLKLISLQEENKLLQEQLPLPENEEESSVPTEQKINYAEEITKILAAKKIVFIGGHPNIMGKFSQKYPDATVISHNKAILANQPLENADAVLFKTDSMGHKEYNPIKDLADRRNIPVGYIGDFTSLSLVEQSVYETLSSISVKAGWLNDMHK